MATKGNDPYGSARTTTEYQDHKRPVSDSRYVRSVWIIVGLFICLMLLALGIYAWPRTNPDPAPGGNPANGIVRQPGPASNKL